MRRFTVPFWIALHAAPLLLVPAVTHGLHRHIGIDAASATAHLLILVMIASGETAILAPFLARPGTWAWRSACGLALGLVAGLVAMSTIDLAGFDRAATFGGTVAAGTVFSAMQAPAQSLSRWRWVLTALAGWIVGAIVFRSIIATLSTLAPYAISYNAGHNELLWSAVGLAAHGVFTAWNVRALARRHAAG